MSRIAKTLKNAKIGILFYLGVLGVNFFSRNYFLTYLGDEFMGLTATLRSFLDFLNLAELGIGTAVGFALYKPILDKNHGLINEIIGLVGLLYRKIGITVFLGAVILSFFFPLIFKDLEIDLFIAYLAFYIFLINALLGYFYNYHLILLEADQKSYVVISYFQGANIIKLIVQTVTVFYLKNVVIWLLLELALSIFYAFIIRVKIKKEYNWLIQNNHGEITLKNFKELTTKIKQTFIHKISSFVLGGTDQILIFTLINIQSVTFYSNYQLIFAQITGLLSNFFKNNGASIGNLVAEGDKENIDKIFWELMAIRFLVGGFFAMGIYFLLEPFIVLWIGSKYIMSERILALMSINFLISQTRKPVENFKNAYGLFADTWAPIAEMTINLSLSLYLGSFLGIEGILIGTLTSVFIIVLLWKPFYLYRYGFDRNFIHYFPQYFNLIASLSISFYLISQLFDFMKFESSNFLEWGLMAIIYCSIILLIYCFFLYLFSEGFRKFTQRVLNLIKI